MHEKLTIIVTGYAATYPVGGATWDYLQYVLGFKRLGHRVYYLEDTGQWTWDVNQDTFSDDASSNAAYLAKCIAALDSGLAHNWALRDVHGRYYGMSQAQVARLCRETDVFINATSIGLSNGSARLPVAKDSLRAGLVVADVIFNPAETRLLRDAAERGAKTLDGLGMLVNQAVIGFKIWTGVDPDATVMREALEEFLEL